MFSMASNLQCLAERISCDVFAADFQWSLFYAALNSYRHDSVLRPYPSFLTREQDGEKDFDHMRTVAKEIKGLKEVLLEEKISLSSEGSVLLAWVLDAKNFTLKSHPASKFEDIEKMTGQIVKTTRPNFIFEVIYQPLAEARFASIRKDLGVTYAYHGSRLENFHSIIHNGLRNHMNKNSVFGKGTYLSSELSVCMAYSPIGQGWRHSELGDKLSCIAVCEVIIHPDVKSQTKESRTTGSFWMSNNTVPEKYFIVQNDELIRVKFLLLYSENPRPKNSRMTTLRSWIFQNRFCLMMAAYILVLICIGFVNSRTFRMIYRHYFSTFQ